MTHTHAGPVVRADCSRALSARALSPIASLTLALCTSVDHGRGLVDSISLTRRMAVAVSPSFACPYGAVDMGLDGGCAAISRRASSGGRAPRRTRAPRFV